MPRRPRWELPHVPQYVLQQPADGRWLFHDELDVETYLSMVSEACTMALCEVHAFACSPKEVQLLLTGREAGAVSAALQVVAQRFSRHANKRDRTRVPLWRGRYLSCMVGGAQHVLHAHWQIEQDEACSIGSKADAGVTRSSYPANALGETMSFLTPHRSYLALGPTGAERAARYRLGFGDETAIDGSLALHTRRGCPWGSENFLRKLEERMGELPKPRLRGRPRKARMWVPHDSLKSLSLFFLTSWLGLVETL